MKKYSEVFVNPDLPIKDILKVEAIDKNEAMY